MWPKCRVPASTPLLNYVHRSLIASTATDVPQFARCALETDHAYTGSGHTSPAYDGLHSHRLAVSFVNCLLLFLGRVI